MKSIIIALAFLSGLTVNATTVAQVASVDAQIAAVTLSDAGVLSVDLREGAKKTLKLSNTNKQNLLWAAQMLSESELEIENRLVVCMMMIAPFSIQNLSVYDSKTKEMKIVLSSHSCAISSYTHPKESYQIEAAQVLKAEMLVLAHQLVK